MRRTALLSILNIFALCAVIGGVSLFFLHDADWVGFVLIALAGLCLISLIPFKIGFRAVQPDIMFGIIDNGILAILAIGGGYLGGITGAILGGVVGNAITDGIAGIAEGYSAEKLRVQLINEERTMLKSAVGKMAGCLLGAGVVLQVASFFS